MSGHEMVWEDPPEQTRGPGKWKWFADQLRAHPGRWARFPGKNAPTGASAPTKGFWAGFEFTKRAGAVYGRFVPPPEAPKGAPSLTRRSPTVLPSLATEMDRAGIR